VVTVWICNSGGAYFESRLRNWVAWQIFHGLPQLF
jgi:hypothetical protein